MLTTGGSNTTRSKPPKENSSLKPLGLARLFGYIASFVLAGTIFNINMDGKRFSSSIMYKEAIIFQTPKPRALVHRAMRDTVNPWLEHFKLRHYLTFDLLSDKVTADLLLQVLSFGDIRIIFNGPTDISILNKNNAVMVQGSPLEINGLLGLIINEAPAIFSRTNAFRA